MSFYSYESAYNPKVDVIVVGQDADKLEPSYTMIRMWTGTAPLDNSLGND